VDVKVFGSLVSKNCMEECWGHCNSEKLLSDYQKVREEVEKEKNSIKKENAYLGQFAGSLFENLGNSEISL